MTRKPEVEKPIHAPRRPSPLVLEIEQEWKEHSVMVSEAEPEPEIAPPHSFTAEHPVKLHEMNSFDPDVNGWRVE